MNNLIQDGQGDLSSKRFNSVSATICAVIIAVGGAGMAIWKGNDLGTNVVALILGLFAIGGGIAIASNIVEKK